MLLAKEICNIAIFRALHLGDLLCAIPAVRAIKAAFPDAQMVLVGLPSARAISERFSRYFDDFIPFPAYRGLVDGEADEAAVAAFFEAVRARHFDAVIQMHGDGSLSNNVALSMAGKRTFGYHPAHAPAPSKGTFLPYPAHESEVRRNLGLAALLGAGSDDTRLEFPVAGEEAAELDRVLSQSGVELSDYVCMHPGSKLPSRRWPVERFAAVADALASRGLQIVLTGSQEEIALTADVASHMRYGRPVNLAGETTLGTLGALILRARLLVANDTGVSHIAAALETPSVIIACGSDVERWAPEDRRLHRVLWFDVDCRPCMHVDCPIGHPCAVGVGVEPVLAQCHDLLEQPAAARP